MHNVRLSLCSKIKELYIYLGIYIQTPECCEENWVPYDRLGVCYKLYTTRLEWEDAKDFCSKQDAELTDLYDYTEQMFIKGKLLLFYMTRLEFNFRN
jgi:hypothetical protein